MSLPYRFVSLNDEQNQRRRQLLDGYGHFAQLSILLVPLIYQLGLGVHLLFGRLYRLRDYKPVKDHQSPVVSRFKQPSAANSRLSLRRLCWALDEEVASGWGTRKEWLIAIWWGAWLFVLAVKETGNDYLHVTRRFGIVAASQLPIHYLLALKSWSPIQYLTRLSHEELNSYHRALGRLILVFFATHATLYLNFYVQSSLLLKRIGDRDVILGLTAISTSALLFTTALSKLREYNYRLFFYAHVITSASLLPILYFHVSHLRLYVLEAAGVYVLLILQRNYSQSPSQATITLLPGTNLLSISVPLSKPFQNRTYKPGQHIYLGFPSLPQKLRLNPFTIANLPAHDRKIHLVARALSGTTAIMADLAAKPQPTPLLIEGPYGAARYFPDLASYDRVLLVAGGVGATFTLSIYRSLLLKAASGVQMPKTRFVWVVRDAADAGWGMHTLKEQCGGQLPEGFDLYVTNKTNGRGQAEHEASPTEEQIELQERENLLSSGDFDAMDASLTEKIASEGRPHLRAIVDDIFECEKGDAVAVLVCGPKGLGANVRKEVGRWVGQDRTVFWHSEEFGW